MGNTVPSDPRLPSGLVRTMIEMVAARDSTVMRSFGPVASCLGRKDRNKKESEIESSYIRPGSSVKVAAAVKSRAYAITWNWKTKDS
jgi:hypothetical protein